MKIGDVNDIFPIIRDVMFTSRFRFCDAQEPPFKHNTFDLEIFFFLRTFISDHTLQNHVIVTSLVHDEFECQLSCLSNDTCESFNVLPNKPSHNRICELNNATRHDKPKDLKWKKGSSHYSPLQVC